MSRFLRNTLRTLRQGVRGFTIEVVALGGLFAVAALVAFVLTQVF